jgi:hypothetical protein
MSVNHDYHVRGGKGRWAPKADWRVKYGSVPVGDPLRARAAFREECWSCGGHPKHEPGKCGEVSLFTKKPCECPGS